MPNYGPSAALAVPVSAEAKELTPGQWLQGMRQRLRKMQKEYPQELLESEWEQRTGESLSLKNWGSLMDSLELQTRLMERMLWVESPLKLSELEPVEDAEMLVDPVDLIAEIT